jgi:Rubisco accumulation factor 1 alpha helical domain/Rubisco accumulation factor 1 helix turn helix domain
MGGPGGNFGGDMNRGQPGRLIIPGQEGAAAGARPGGGGLVIPGGNNTSGVTGTAPSMQGPEFRNFRPPPGFMDKDGVKDTLSDTPQQEMLNRLQAQAGHWHELAKLLPALQAKGIDAFTVEESTGLERKTQNLWTSSASIYDALKKSGLVKDEIMAYYDVPGAENLLHELRFLSLKQRAAAVVYIAENALDDAACTVLARAMKEHERRNGRRDGFSESPEDSLAYKYYRDALECRDQEEAAKYAKKGLALVQTEDGRAKLVGLGKEKLKQI